METEAVKEILGMSENARRHLQHKLRDGLQSVVACIEEGELEDASRQVLEMSDVLREMGL